MEFLKNFFSRRDNPDSSKVKSSPKLEAAIPKTEFREFSLDNFKEAREICTAGRDDIQDWIEKAYGFETLPVRIGNSGLYALLNGFSEMLLEVGDGNMEEFWKKSENFRKSVDKIAELAIYGAMELRKKLEEMLKNKTTSGLKIENNNRVSTKMLEQLESIQSWIDSTAINFVGIERDGGTESDKLYFRELPKTKPANYEAQSDSGAPDKGKAKAVFALPTMICYANCRMLLSALDANVKVNSAMKKGFESLVSNAPEGSLGRLKSKAVLLSQQEKFDLSSQQNRAWNGYIDTLADCVKHDDGHCPQISRGNLEFYFVSKEAGNEYKLNICKGVV